MICLVFRHCVAGYASACGLTPEDIAREESVKLETVQESLRQARGEILFPLRTELEDANLKLRRRVMNELADAITSWSPRRRRVMVQPCKQVLYYYTRHYTRNAPCPQMIDSKGRNL